MVISSLRSAVAISPFVDRGLASSPQFVGEFSPKKRPWPCFFQENCGFNGREFLT
jgi:hypothetical protein